MIIVVVSIVMVKFESQPYSNGKGFWSAPYKELSPPVWRNLLSNSPPPAMKWPSQKIIPTPAINDVVRTGMCHGAYPPKKSLQLKLIDINCNYQLILFCDRSPINCPIRKLVVIFVHHRPMQLSAFFPLEEELFLIRGEGPIITINN